VNVGEQRKRAVKTGLAGHQHLLLMRDPSFESFEWFESF